MTELIRPIVLSALSEDIGTGDISSSLLDDTLVSAKIICREKAVISGVDYAALCFYELDPNVTIEWQIKEGGICDPGQTLCLLKGQSRAMISAERTALNFLQTLSATATQTRHLVDLIAHTKTKLLDTREKPYQISAMHKNKQSKVVAVSIIEWDCMTVSCLRRIIFQRLVRLKGQLIER